MWSLENLSSPLLISHASPSSLSSPPSLSSVSVLTGVVWCGGARLVRADVCAQIPPAYQR